MTEVKTVDEHSGEKSVDEGYTMEVRPSDDAILMVREALQLCLLTNRNFVDMMRGMVFAVDGDTKTFSPTEEYVAAYDELVQKLNEEAEQKAKEIEAYAAIEYAALEAHSRGETSGDA